MICHCQKYKEKKFYLIDSASYDNIRHKEWDFM